MTLKITQLKRLTQREDLKVRLTFIAEDGRVVKTTLNQTEAQTLLDKIKAQPLTETLGENGVIEVFTRWNIEPFQINLPENLKTITNHPYFETKTYMDYTWIELHPYLIRTGQFLTLNIKTEASLGGL